MLPQSPAVWRRSLGINKHTPPHEKGPHPSNLIPLQIQLRIQLTTIQQMLDEMPR